MDGHWPTCGRARLLTHAALLLWSAKFALDRNRCSPATVAVLASHPADFDFACPACKHRLKSPATGSTSAAPTGATPPVDSARSLSPPTITISRLVKAGDRWPELSKAQWVGVWVYGQANLGTAMRASESQVEDGAPNRNRAAPEGADFSGGVRSQQAAAFALTKMGCSSKDRIG